MICSTLKFKAAENLPLRPSKVKNTELPPEFRLARLVANVWNPHPSWNVTTPAYRWYRVDVGQEIRRIDSSNIIPLLRGSLVLSALPRSVEYFSVVEGDLSGDLVFETLPEKLSHLDLSCNRFKNSSPLRFDSLPSVVRYLNLNSNHLIGPLELECLPEELEHLLLSKNLFSGNTTVGVLSGKLKQLSLDGNRELGGKVELFQSSGTRISFSDTDISATYDYRRAILSHK